jgi:hypothetical protein
MFSMWLCRSGWVEIWVPWTTTIVSHPDSTLKSRISFPDCECTHRAPISHSPRVPSPLFPPPPWSPNYINFVTCRGSIASVDVEPYDIVQNSRPRFFSITDDIIKFFIMQGRLKLHTGKSISAHFSQIGLRRVISVVHLNTGSFIKNRFNSDRFHWYCINGHPKKLGNLALLIGAGAK